MINSGYKNSILHRLKIIGGHLNKVIKMVESDAYCLDILQQSTAVSRALNQVEQLILEKHLRTCVKDSLTTRRGVEEKVDEIIKVFKVRR